jgi:sulfatase modifying factor 1
MAAVARFVLVGILAAGSGLLGGRFLLSPPGADGEALSPAADAPQSSPLVARAEAAERSLSRVDEALDRARARIRELEAELRAAPVAGAESAQGAAEGGAAEGGAAEVGAAEVGATGKAADALAAAELSAGAQPLESALRPADAELAARNSLLESSLAERDAALSAAERERRSLREDLAQQLAAAEQLEQRSASLAAELAHSRSEVAALEQRERSATERAAAAQSERDAVLRLAARARLAQLRRELDSLWPAQPEQISALTHWIARARAEVAELDGHRAALASLGDDGTPAAPEVHWGRGELQALVDELTAFADPRRGPLDGAAPEFGWGATRRLAFAETVAAATVGGEPARAAWRAALRDLEQDPRTEDLLLEPALGLMPLGRDPRSGLSEFAWTPSGTVPLRDERGELQLDEGSAAVLVLLPGGPTFVGAQAQDRGAPNHDPVAAAEEGPVRAVRLGPFLIGKHELSQGQWLRLTGHNPSRYGPGTGGSPEGTGGSPEGTVQHFGGRPMSWLQPLTDVDWTTAARVLAQQGARLPSEAEWEYAARAGTGTPWFTGDTAKSLAGAVNLADRYAGAHGGSSWVGRLEWLDDGHTVAAPLGTYRANAFGLHDVHGNVWEWCADSYLAARPTSAVPLVDPLHEDPSTRLRVYRGGAYNSNALEARSSHRGSSAEDRAGAALGLRLALDL